MCNNEKSCITINCGCCGNDGGESITSGFKETILYGNAIDVVGVYDLTDNIENYNDVCIVHEQANEKQRQCLTIPVSALCDMQMVCHGNSTLSAYANFKIDGNKLNVTHVEDSYRIVRLIGRKY